MFRTDNVRFVTDSVELIDHDGRRRVPPMSPAARERLQVFADKHVKTADFQRRLAETRRRMEDEQARQND
jgi:hypothetical protein